MNQLQMRIRQILVGQTTVNPDRIICRRDGTVEIRRVYYHRSATPSEWAEKVRQVLASNGVQCRVAGSEIWAAWPRDSYLVAVAMPEVNG